MVQSISAHYETAFQEKQQNISLAPQTKFCNEQENKRF